MEIEKESLMKLRKLEQHLVNVIEKVDKEINQVDVEWLNLRSIAVKKIKSQLPKSENTPKTIPAEVVPPVQKEFRDSDFQFLDIDLELNPKVNQTVDEEFDSD